MKSNKSYVGSFSAEWLWHRRTQLDSASGTGESERTFRAKTGLSRQELEGKLVLDVGCGMGRFMEVALNDGARVIGVDMSRAVVAARENVGSYPNADIIRADIFNLPFKEGVFDCVYSVGVLHHTPDAAEAFRCLPGLIKGGGSCSVWVYTNETIPDKIHNLVSGIYRLVTVRLPLRLLYALCHLAVPFYHIGWLPVLGFVSRIALPMSSHPRADWRVLDTFDWYSARYQSKHTFDEVEGWFRSADMSDIERLSVPVAVRGRRCDGSR